MRNSKILKSVLFILSLICFSRLLTFLLCPLSSLNKKFIAYHSVKENIDFLILGSSLELDGIDANVISKEFNENAFVMAPQGSYPESIYWLLVDIANKHNLKNLIVGWDILQNFELPPYKYPHEEEIFREFLSDIKGNKELTKIVFKGIMKQRYTSTFFDWSSFPENIKNIPEVINSRKKIVDKIEVFRPMDLNDRKKSNFDSVVNTVYGKKIQENDKEYILKIRDFCKKKNINMFVISCPIPEVIMDAVPEINDCIKISYDFMLDSEIQYIHCNNQNYFADSMNNENFKDCYGHIIPPYREIYTKAICAWIKSF